ncbi:hypothetical protein AAGS61_03325 [Lysinibacillus sp. KU-BSD001]|uniref:hypothetical protein n=1 Tax=Lysinibacillus sp. KU-BSD001 TaxID=3141328 RepID=UPI0036E764CD
MKKHELFQFLMHGSKSEVREYLLQYDVDLSKSEIKKLRTVFAEANPTWLLMGIPDGVLKNAEQVVGSKKYEKLMDRLK